MTRKTKLAGGKSKKTKRAQISIGIYLAVDGARAPKLKNVDSNKTKGRKSSTFT
jgi:hypothetical protein